MFFFITYQKRKKKSWPFSLFYFFTFYLNCFYWKSLISLKRKRIRKITESNNNNKLTRTIKALEMLGSEIKQQLKKKKHCLNELVFLFCVFVFYFNLNIIQERNKWNLKKKQKKKKTTNTILKEIVTSLKINTVTSCTKILWAKIFFSKPSPVFYQNWVSYKITFDHEGIYQDCLLTKRFPLISENRFFPTSPSLNS